MTETTVRPVTVIDRALSGIERLGNRLPNPVVLFLGLFGLLGIVSTVLALAGATVTVPGAADSLAVKALFSGEGVAWFLQSMVKNFAEFPPIAAVLVMIMARRPRACRCTSS